MPVQIVTIHIQGSEQPRQRLTFRMLAMQTCPAAHFLHLLVCCCFPDGLCKYRVRTDLDPVADRRHLIEYLAYGALKTHRLAYILPPILGIQLSTINP